MRALIALVIATAGCASGPAPIREPVSDVVPADVLFERHLRAVGGARAVEKLARATVRFVVRYPDRGVEGTGSLAIGEDGAKLVLDLEGVGRIERTYDEPWAMDVHFDAHLARHYSAAKTIGKSELDGIAVWQVEAQGPTGATTLTFDKSGGELVALKSQVETPDGSMSTSSRYADYQDFGGVRCARRVTQRTGDRVQVIEIRAIDLE